MCHQLWTFRSGCALTTHILDGHAIPNFGVRYIIPMYKHWTPVNIEHFNQRCVHKSKTKITLYLHFNYGRFSHQIPMWRLNNPLKLRLRDTWEMPKGIVLIWCVCVFFLFSNLQLLFNPFAGYSSRLKWERNT